MEGGNADTLDGKHASEFALVSYVQELLTSAESSLEYLQSQIGDASVSEQIEDALENFSSGKTLAEHLTEEDMVLSSRQYGDTLPEPGIPGRIFFLRVSD